MKFELKSIPAPLDGVPRAESEGSTEWWLLEMNGWRCNVGMFRGYGPPCVRHVEESHKVFVGMSKAVAILNDDDGIPYQIHFHPRHAGLSDPFVRIRHDKDNAVVFANGDTDFLVMDEEGNPMWSDIVRGIIDRIVVHEDIVYVDAEGKQSRFELATGKFLGEKS